MPPKTQATVATRGRAPAPKAGVGAGAGRSRDPSPEKPGNAVRSSSQQRPVSSQTAKPAVGARPASKSSSPVRQKTAASGGQTAEKDALIDKNEELLGFLSTVKNKRVEENRILKRVLARSKVLPRFTKEQKDAYVTPSNCKEACITLQSWFRMLRAKAEATRRRSAVITRVRERLAQQQQHLGAQIAPRLTSRLTSRPPSSAEAKPVVKEEDDQGAHRRMLPEPLNLSENPVFRAMGIRMRVSEYKQDPNAQASAFMLQSYLRSKLACLRHRSVLKATEVLICGARRGMQHLPWRQKYARIILIAYIARWVRRRLRSVKASAIRVVQAIARRRTIREVREARRKWVIARFNDGYRAYKMGFIREIKKRRDLLVRVQAAIRRTRDLSIYSVQVQEARYNADLKLRQKRAAVLLSSRSRMAIAHTRMYDFAYRACVLRRYTRTRAAEEAHQERVLAGKELARHVTSVAAQLKSSLAMVMPLARHVRAYRGSIRAAERLQAVCRLWCIEVIGIQSKVEMLEGTKQGRFHLSFRQKTAAAIELQRGARRAIAFYPSRALRPFTFKEPSAYCLVLSETAKLQGYMRAHRIRHIIKGLTEQYGTSMLQGQAKMALQRRRYIRMVAGYVRATSAVQRALTNRWYLSTFKAQVVLQSFVRMRSTPDAGLKYCRMPTRDLARALQAQLRMSLVSRAYAQRRDSTVTIEAIVKRSVYRLQYVSVKVWCRKAGGTGVDLDKLFGKLTIAMDTRGTPFWKKKAFVERREHRSQVYGSVGAVAGQAMTEKKRQRMQEARRQAGLKEQAEVRGGAKQFGVMINMSIPAGTQRVILEGRLAKVLSESVVILDELGASTVEDTYRHFFLRNGKQTRRIIRYTRDRVATVVPPFERMPVGGSRFEIIDLEPAPFEPNLVKLRREREFAAARCIQNSWRCRTATAEYDARLGRHLARLARLREEEEFERKLGLEREQRRLQHLRDEAARRAAIEEGRRQLMEAQAIYDEKIRLKKEAKRKQMEKLWGLKPSIPVMPTRPGTNRSPSPRVGQWMIATDQKPEHKPAPPAPQELDTLRVEARARLAMLADEMASDDDVEMFFSKRTRVLPEIFPNNKNRTMSLVLREADRHGSSEEVRLPAVRRHSAHSDGSADSSGKTLVVGSSMHVRRRAKKGMAGVYIDLSPPKMDLATAAALERLDKDRAEQRISDEEYRARVREVKQKWREGLKGPTTSERTFEWDSSVRIEDKDRDVWGFDPNEFEFDPRFEKPDFDPVVDVDESWNFSRDDSRMTQYAGPSMYRRAA